MNGNERLIGHTCTAYETPVSILDRAESWPYLPVEIVRLSTPISLMSTSEDDLLNTVRGERYSDLNLPAGLSALVVAIAEPIPGAAPYIYWPWFVDLANPDTRERRRKGSG
jgi:hypothetical protein